MSIEATANIAEDQSRGHAGEKPNEAVKSPPDVFADLDNLRVSTGVLVGATEVVTHIPVRRPKKTEFVRINPDPAYQIDTLIIEDPETREAFLVAPSMHTQLGSEGKLVRLMLAITAQGALFLWPLALPNAEGVEMRG